MSENAHSYQTDVPVEQVNTQDVSQAFEEKAAVETENAETHPAEVEAATESETQSDDFSSKFAALSRKEKDIRHREQQLEQKLAEFEEKFQAMNAPKEEATEPELPLEYRIKKNPIETLESMGITYEQLTNIVLNDGKMSPEMQMRLMKEEIERDYQSKYEKLENKLIEKERQEEEASYEKTINNFKSDIKGFIDSSEEYELTQANEAYDLVYDVIQDYYEEHGRILDTREAADQVESYLEEELQKLAKKSNKLKQWMSPEAKPAVNRQSPTLSNSSSVASTPSTGTGMLSREESLAKLAPLIKWED